MHTPFLKRRHGPTPASATRPCYPSRRPPGKDGRDSCTRRCLPRCEGLEHHEIYVSGPPQMIEAVRRDFMARGVAESAISFDSFDYAPIRPRASR